jgi:cell wall assembly regulator SMI1
MAVAFSEPQAPASEESIQRLERQIGRPLPSGYRDFLRQHDGGPLDLNDKAVNEVFGLGDDVPDFASMWQKLETYRERVPDWLLLVANDSFGNLFTISLRPQDEGSVWFWDHEKEADEDEPPTEDNIRQVAPDWPTFLNSLQPVDLSQA